MKLVTEVLQDIRQCSLSQIRAELDYLHYLATKPCEQKFPPVYDHITAFFERASKRPKQEEVD